MSVAKKVILLLLVLMALMAYCVYTQIQQEQLLQTQTSIAVIEDEVPNNEIIEKDQALDEKELQENIEKNIEDNFETQEQIKSEIIQEIPITPKKTEQLQEQIENLLQDNPIMFQRMSYDITPKSQMTLKQIASLLIQNPDIQVEVGGHTDAKGDNEFNMMISEKRAQSVKEQLVILGVNEELIHAVGYGETKPMVANDPDGYSLANRRVEIKIIKEEL
jgi:outer membrane protein OmpA-like peptidoglycan-associated protein